MAKFYLVTPVKVGSTQYLPGKLIDDVVTDTSSLIAAGAVLWPEADASMRTAAAKAAIAHLNGASIEMLVSIMRDGVVQSQETGGATEFEGVKAALGAASSAVSFNGQQLKSVADPTLAQDVATKNYVDTGATAEVPATRLVTAGVGLTGGGSLAADRTFNVVGNGPNPVRVVLWGNSEVAGPGNSGYEDAPEGHLEPFVRIVRSRRGDVRLLGRNLSLPTRLMVGRVPGICHEGNSGKRIDELTALIATSLAITGAVDCSIFCGGTNDFANGDSVATVQGRFVANMAAQRAAYPTAWIIAITIPDYKADAGIGALVDTYNAALAAQVAALGDAKIVFADAYSGGGTKGLYTDNKHPSATLADRAGRILADKFESLFPIHRDGDAFPRVLRKRDQISLQGTSTDTPVSSLGTDGIRIPTHANLNPGATNSWLAGLWWLPAAIAGLHSILSYGDGRVCLFHTGGNLVLYLGQIAQATVTLPTGVIRSGKAHRTILGRDHDLGVYYAAINGVVVAKWSDAGYNPTDGLAWYIGDNAVDHLGSIGAYKRFHFGAVNVPKFNTAVLDATNGKSYALEEAIERDYWDQAPIPGITYASELNDGISAGISVDRGFTANVGFLERTTDHTNPGGWIWVATAWPWLRGAAPKLVQVADIDQSSPTADGGLGDYLLNVRPGSVPDATRKSIWLNGDSNCAGSNGAQTGFAGGWRHPIERELRIRRSDFDFVGSIATMPEKSSMGGLVWHDGHSGEKIEDLTTNLSARLALCLSTPNIVLHSIGTNNYLAGDTAAQMLVKLQAYDAALLAALPAARIMVVPPPRPVDGTTTHATLAAIQAVHDAYVPLLAAHCLTDTRLQYVDSISQLGSGDFQVDGVHLLRSGQASKGAADAEAIDAYMGRPTRKQPTLPRHFRQRQPQYSIAIASATDGLTLAGPNGYKVNAASYALAIDYYFTALDAAALHTIAAYGPYGSGSFWFLLCQQGSALRLYWNDVGGTIVAGPSELALLVNRWIRAVLLAHYNGAASSVGLYVNGKLVNIVTGLAARTAATQTFYAGAGPNFSAAQGYLSRVRAFSGAGVPRPGTMAAQLAVEDDFFNDGPIAPGLCKAHHDLDGALTDDVYGGGALVFAGGAANATPWPNVTPRRPWEITDDYFASPGFLTGTFTLNGVAQVDVAGNFPANATIEWSLAAVGATPGVVAPYFSAAQIAGHFYVKSGTALANDIYNWRATW